MKKRQKAAIIIAIIVLLLVIGTLTVNYFRYSSCSGADAIEKPGCAAKLAGENATQEAKPLLRINFGSRYLEIG